MRYGEYLIAVQKRQRGYYAGVRLAVEMLDAGTEPTLEIEIQNTYEWDTWHEGIRFGVALVLEALPLDQRALHIRVLELRGHPVDTTLICVAFATVQALLSALEWEPTNQPAFEDELGVFVFPQLLR